MPCVLSFLDALDDYDGRGRWWVPLNANVSTEHGHTQRNRDFLFVKMCIENNIKHFLFGEKIISYIFYLEITEYFLNYCDEITIFSRRKGAKFFRLTLA